MRVNVVLPTDFAGMISTTKKGMPSNGSRAEAPDS